MNKLVFPIIFIAVTLSFLNSTHLFAQTNPPLFKPPNNQYWLIARVLDTEPFTLEYLDDSTRHLPSSSRNQNYGVGVVVNPQFQSKEIKKFEVGDIVSGESCHPEIQMKYCGERIETQKVDDAGGLALLPAIIINLKKLDEADKEKYRNRGFLFRYTPKVGTIIRDLTIFRDGTIILNGLYGNHIQKKLGEKELADLIKNYLTEEINGISSDEEVYFHNLNPSFFVAVSRYQKLNVENPSSKVKNFLTRLNNIISKQLQNATYSINYRWHFRIKAWRFGNILPLDKVISEKWFAPRQKRFAQMKPPSKFLNEAKEKAGNANINLYRYKGKIYGFYFATCTDRKTNTWECFQAWEVIKGNVPAPPQSIYNDWSGKLQIKLKNISKNGLDISPAELEKHRKFYTSFLYGSNVSYKEGDYLYMGLIVNFR